jgi:wyosine [tRNA(Phe)-imidazoG37] synthetase (radical SAM superfamily)
VREAILPFDYVLPSFDAASQKVFETINRPHRDLNVNDITAGLIAFSKQYLGMVWLEVFIIPGINDSQDELNRFKEAILRINPGRVQLNSLDRPGTIGSVKTATLERLREIAALFKPLPVEIISRASLGGPVADVKDAQTLILSTLPRRPMIIEEIAVLTGLIINDCAAILKRLCEEGAITSSVVNNREFYRIL